MLTRDEEEVLDRLLGGVVAVDSQGEIVYFNGDAWALLGWDPKEILGEPVTALLPAGWVRSAQAFAEAVRERRTRLLGRRIRIELLDQDGGEVKLDARMRLFHRPDGTDLLALSLHLPTPDAAPDVTLGVPGDPLLA